MNEEAEQRRQEALEGRGFRGGALAEEHMVSEEEIESSDEEEIEDDGMVYDIDSE